MQRLTPSDAPVVRAIVVASAGYPSRSSMKAATSSRTSCRPTESVYAPMPPPLRVDRCSASEGVQRALSKQGLEKTQRKQGLEKTQRRPPLTRTRMKSMTDEIDGTFRLTVSSTVPQIQDTRTLLP
jgi:hypothetical protein